MVHPGEGTNWGAPNTFPLHRPVVVALMENDVETTGSQTGKTMDNRSQKTPKKNMQIETCDKIHCPWPYNHDNPGVLRSELPNYSVRRLLPKQFKAKMRFRYS